MNEFAPLGFSVPTFRRPELLDIALQSIVPEARPLRAPIYIPDNSCDQTNELVVRKWQGAYPLVIHEVNGENIGIDRNVDRAISRCPSTYVHVIGDDDLLMPGFASRVMDVILTMQPGHIICSYIYLSNSYKALTGNAVIRSDARVSSMRMLLPRYGWTLGFIGAHVFRRDRFVAGSIDGFGTYFHHLRRLLEYLDPDEPIGFVREPLIGNRADDESTPTWSGDRLSVVFGLERALAIAMRERYTATDIDLTVAATRRYSGHARFLRLLYWAALAERGGDGEKYWNSLAQFVASTRHQRLQRVPHFVYGPLLTLYPMARRTKRYIDRFVAWRKK